MSEKRVEDAEKLVASLGIPQNKEDVEEIFYKLKNNRNLPDVDNCLISYASVLCVKTRETGNIYVDELITKLMANCKKEYLENLRYDYSDFSETITESDRQMDAKRTDPNKIGPLMFAGRPTTREVIPYDFETRRRVLIQLHKGIVKNTNITIEQLLYANKVVGSDGMRFHTDVEEDFLEERENIFLEALQSRECKYTIQELIDWRKTHIGRFKS